MKRLVTGNIGTFTKLLILRDAFKTYVSCNPCFQLLSTPVLNISAKLLISRKYDGKPVRNVFHKFQTVSV